MGAQSDVERHRKAIQSLQAKIATESRKVATARDRANKARQQAAAASTPSSARSKLGEADRREKEANEAEKRRSGYERQVSDKQKALHQAEAKLDKERAIDQQRALKRIEERARRTERQFRSTASALETPIESSSAARTAVEAHDVFISHASEDKFEVARPLADLLVAHGLNVWYDEFSLTIGDSLRRKIDRGLAESRFGVIVLSPDFFRKEWPQAELDGLVAKQRASGSKVLLPIWHRVTRDDVLAQSPTLVDLKALNTSVMTMAEVAAEIAAVVGAPVMGQHGIDGQRREGAELGPVRDELRKMVFDGRLRSEIDALVDDPELAVS